jgi:hypothetical protein
MWRFAFNCVCLSLCMQFALLTSSLGSVAAEMPRILGIVSKSTHLDIFDAPSDFVWLRLNRFSSGITKYFLSQFWTIINLVAIGIAF